MMEKTKDDTWMIECDGCGDNEESSEGLTFNDAMQEFKDSDGYRNKHNETDGWQNFCPSCLKDMT